MSNLIPLQFGCCYHIFNRGINRENIFVEEDNYRYFLELFAKHILPIADLYAYCLLPNHFHLLVRIKTEIDLTGFENLSGLPRPSQKFSNLFNAYAKAFNKRYNRTGSLFQRPFRRVVVTSNAQLFHLVTYIHRNPEKHGLVDDFQDWPYSSYQTLVAETEDTYLNWAEVMSWFGAISNFKHSHQMDAEILKIDNLIADDMD
ncbi:MAG: transposase [Anaerolineales bacterium]|nr:transposase [Anaerolineales bacterium]